MQVYLYDLPVYRLSRPKYEQSLKDLLERSLAPWREVSGKEPPDHVIQVMTQRQYDHFGPWWFNEVVGYIRLHVLGSQIRGEYFSAEKKRSGLGRKKVYVFRSLKLAAEVEIGCFGRAYTSQDVWAAIQKYVERCRRELKKGRIVDDSLLKAIGPHTDWLAVIKQLRQA